jgi:hypothetical protein
VTVLLLLAAFLTKTHSRISLSTFLPAINKHWRTSVCLFCQLPSLFKLYHEVLTVNSVRIYFQRIKFIPLEVFTFHLGHPEPTDIIFDVK